MEDQKGKLEKELEFLKESFESDVINEEEYLSGKERIQKQLNDLKPDQQSEEKEQALEIESKKEEPKESEEPMGEKPEDKSVAEEKLEIEEKRAEEQEEAVQEESKEPVEIIQEEPEKKETKEDVVQEEPKEEETEEQLIPISETEEKAPEDKFKEELVEFADVAKKTNWKLIFASLFIVIIIAALALPFFTGDSDEELKEVSLGNVIAEEIILCSSNKDCSEEGKIGTCLNPGTKDSDCEFRDAVKTELLIVNMEDCFNCDVSRILTLLKGFFPGLYVKTLDYNSEEARDIVGEFDIKTLPAYIFDENFANTFNFDKLKSAFDYIDGRYLMSESASGANYFLQREEVSNRLDLFLIRDDEASLKAEQNLKEFLDSFGNVEFFEHYKEDSLSKELGIKTFPTFLINNKIRFSGVQPADKIREYFCEMNNPEDCSEELSKNLV